MQGEEMSQTCSFLCLARKDDISKEKRQETMA